MGEEERADCDEQSEGVECQHPAVERVLQEGPSRHRRLQGLDSTNPDVGVTHAHRLIRAQVLEQEAQQFDPVLLREQEFPLPYLQFFGTKVSPLAEFCPGPGAARATNVPGSGLLMFRRHGEPT